MKLKQARLTAMLKGAVASIGAMALYAISLGCFIALMLLVISMEEGGENLPSSAVALTQAVVLLSQGTGFVLGSVNLTIMPLLLTILLIALIAQCARKAGGGVLSWVAGLAVWVVLNLMCANGTTLELNDPLPAIIGKTALVWTIGFLIGALPGSAVVEGVRTALNERVDRRVRDAGLLIVLTVLVMFAVATAAGLVVVITWIVRDWQGMALLFDMDGMENGSRILTTIASCAWLPNLMVWGFSWLLGAGFHIGELGVFTLWAGQSAGLPPLPVFGLMPEGVADDRIRIVLQCVVPVLYAIIALLAMLLPGPLKVRPVSFDDVDGIKHLVSTMLTHLGVLAVAALATLGLWAGCFALSDGALGTQRLAHVGVDLVPSLEAVGRSLAFGLAVAWLAVAVVLAAVYGIHWIVGHRSDRSPDSGHTDQTPDDGKGEKPATGGKDSGRAESAGSGTTAESGKPGILERIEGTVRNGGSTQTREEREPRSVRSMRSDDRPAKEHRTARVVEGKAGSAPKAGRVARSARSGSGRQPAQPMKREQSEQPSKEEHDDNNQSSD